MPRLGLVFTIGEGVVHDIKLYIHNVKFLDYLSPPLPSMSDLSGEQMEDVFYDYILDINCTISLRVIPGKSELKRFFVFFEGLPRLRNFPRVRLSLKKKT